MVLNLLIEFSDTSNLNEVKGIIKKYLSEKNAAFVDMNIDGSSSDNLIIADRLGIDDCFSEIWSAVMHGEIAKKLVPFTNCISRFWFVIEGGAVGKGTCESGTITYKAMDDEDYLELTCNSDGSIDENYEEGAFCGEEAFEEFCEDIY